MDKYILKNGVEIDVEEGGTENCFTKKFTNVNEYIDVLTQLTEDNLSEYYIKNSYGERSAVYRNKKCSFSNVTHIFDITGKLSELNVNFVISNVNMILKEIRELKVSQAVQDETIAGLVNEAI